MTSGQSELVNGKDINAIWKTLFTNHNKELSSDYSIVISSVKDTRCNTRYHMQVADTLTINRKGRTNETIDKDASFNIGTNVDTSKSSYTVTKKAENYKALGIALSVYMGIYSSTKHGLTTTMAPAKTTFTIGGVIMINTGLTISIGAIRLKQYFGGVIGTLGVRTRIAAKYKESIQSLAKQRSAKIRNIQNCINRPANPPRSQADEPYDRLIRRPPPPPPSPRIKRNPRNRIIDRADTENSQYSRLCWM